LPRLPPPRYATPRLADLQVSARMPRACLLLTCRLCLHMRSAALSSSAFCPY
jgi:hypothetical protein